MGLLTVGNDKRAILNRGVHEWILLHRRLILILIEDVLRQLGLAVVARLISKDLSTEPMSAILRLEHLLGRSSDLMVTAKQVNSVALGWLRRLGLGSRDDEVVSTCREDLIILLRR